MANLSPVFNDEQLDNNGIPLVGGQIIFYLAGTTTPTATYTTQAGDVTQTSPIILNIRGESQLPIWLTAGLSYKARLFDAANILIREFDNITGINDTTDSGGAATNSEWIGSLLPVFLTGTSFSVAGDQTGILTKYRRTKCICSAGTVYGTISSATYGSGVTTIVQVNDGIILDSGLSSFQYGLLSSSNRSYLPSVPSGSIMPFFQPSAPLGWTKITTHNNKLLRVVSGFGGGSGGSHSPLVMNLVPNHTHTFTTNNESNDHTHDYTSPAATVLLTVAAGATAIVPGSYTDTTTGRSTTHTHTGTTDNNAGTNWQPYYIDMILASKD